MTVWGDLTSVEMKGADRSKVSGCRNIHWSIEATVHGRFPFVSEVGGRLR